MKLHQFKNSITYLLLALFFTMKIAGLHSITHLDNHDEHTDCAICDYITVQNNTPILSVNFTFTEVCKLKPILAQKITKGYNVYFSNPDSSVQLFCRPPPPYC
ncbi:hypothetical protein AX016_2420 [Cellulophaga sp. RHA19]|uniref:hypothetical protein n=1 Tax=Cellulophaga sp. RHA19 TaxID=1798237 RepID=UPI000CC29040|nr:hypothetical protein [Cellulophaga sp. RHA19]PKB44205.1 hypothetical protein AX016_2420 [Cellulophaga sp. RHA19]